MIHFVGADWRWTQTPGWVQVSTANVQSAVVSSDGQTVDADFGKKGLKMYGLIWTTISNLDPEQMQVG